MSQRTEKSLACCPGWFLTVWGMWCYRYMDWLWQDHSCSSTASIFNMLSNFQNVTRAAACNALVVYGVLVTFTSVNDLHKIFYRLKKRKYFSFQNSLMRRDDYNCFHVHKKHIWDIEYDLWSNVFIRVRQLWKSLFLGKCTRTFKMPFTLWSENVLISSCWKQLALALPSK